MNSSTRMEVSPGERVEDGREATLAEIRVLGEKKTELEDAIRKLSELTGDIDGLEDKKLELELEVSRLEAAIASLSKDKDKLKSDVTDKNIEAGVLSKKLVDLAQAVKESYDSNQVFIGNSSRLQSEIAELDIKKTGTMRALDEGARRSVETNSLVTSLEAAVLAKRAELVGLDETLVLRKAESAAELAKISGETLQANDRLAAAAASLATAEKAIIAANEQAAAIVARALVDDLEASGVIVAKQLELDAREGELSIKESFLIEKTEQLKAAKKDLEKFYNRTISNINL